MRYDTPIYFQKLTPGEYDPATGNYGEDTISEDMKSASVMDTGTNTMMLVYSGIKEGSLTIHPVSYTHLDVYKRQMRDICPAPRSSCMENWQW